MAKYKVIEGGVIAEGKEYFVGDVVELSDKTGAVLVANGAVELVAVSSKPAAPVTQKSKADDKGD